MIAAQTTGRGRRENSLRRELKVVEAQGSFESRSPRKLGSRSLRMTVPN